MLHLDATFDSGCRAQRAQWGAAAAGGGVFSTGCSKRYKKIKVFWLNLFLRLTTQKCHMNSYHFLTNMFFAKQLRCFLKSYEKYCAKLWSNHSLVNSQNVVCSQLDQPERKKRWRLNGYRANCMLNVYKVMPGSGCFSMCFLFNWLVVLNIMFYFPFFEVILKFGEW